MNDVRRAEKSGNLSTVDIKSSNEHLLFLLIDWYILPHNHFHSAVIYRMEDDVLLVILTLKAIWPLSVFLPSIFGSFHWAASMAVLRILSVISTLLK